MRTIIIKWDIMLREMLFEREDPYVPWIYYGEEVLLMITLTNNKITYPLETLIYTGTLDCDYDLKTLHFIDVTTSKFNVPGDWNGSTSNPTLGQLSVRLDAENDNYFNRIKTLKEITGKLEIRGRQALDDGKIHLEIKVPFKIKNTIHRGLSCE